MSPTPWYIATNVLAIVVFLFCTLAVAVASAVVIWSLRRIDKTLAPAMASLVAMDKPLAALAEELDKLAGFASELKELKEGDLRIIQAQVKSVNELRMAVEELTATVFQGPEKAEKRRPRRPNAPTEQDEITAERRAQEGSGPAIAADLNEFLEDRAKHGGVV